MTRFIMFFNQHFKYFQLYDKYKILIYSYLFLSSSQFDTFWIPACQFSLTSPGPLCMLFIFLPIACSPVKNQYIYCGDISPLYFTTSSVFISSISYLYFLTSYFHIWDALSYASYLFHCFCDVLFCSIYAWHSVRKM